MVMSPEMRRREASGIMRQPGTEGLLRGAGGGDVTRILNMKWFRSFLKRKRLRLNCAGALPARQPLMPSKSSLPSVGPNEKRNILLPAVGSRSALPAKRSPLRASGGCWAHRGKLQKAGGAAFKRTRSPPGRRRGSVAGLSAPGHGCRVDCHSCALPLVTTRKTPK